MTWHRRISRILAALAVLGTVSAAHAQPAPATLFRGVRVFDGERMLGERDVLVRDGRIDRVGTGIAAPAGAAVVDGRGKTLLPGLIDAHTHTWGDALAQALVFGVTTELDMFSAPAVGAAARAEQAAGRAHGRADLFSAGVLVTVPHGHGTEYGVPIPTLTSADSAQAFVDARIAEGSDYIKLVYDDGHTYGMGIPTLTPEVMRATIAAAHRRGKLAVVHIGDLAGARAAIDAGADGLVHLFVDQQPNAELGRFVAAHRAFVIPTLTVLMSITGTAGGAPLADDARLTPYLSPADVTSLRQGFPRTRNTPAQSYAAAEASVRQLLSAGVPLLAGTDAGNPGTLHGAALHRELELLVNAGLTPVQALAAATSTPARAFRLADRGRIAAGMRADLLLVDGDPSADITATRAIAGVWKGGVPLDRAGYAATVAAAREQAARPAPRLGPGVASDFEAGTPSAAFGAGWMVTDDKQAGGRSAGAMEVVDGGAAGTTKSLSITGIISDAVPYAWAGAMLSPGTQPMAPADLSAARGIHFWARGDGGTYRVMVFAQEKGMMPLQQTFVAGPEWTEHTIPFSDFDGIDGKGLMAVIFAGGPRPGPFAFQVDEVGFR